LSIRALSKKKVTYLAIWVEKGKRTRRGGGEKKVGKGG